jgi:catechol 2,3-dioxygenase-like lactoylglutathione lyase family enzyme/quercetin dioxygenase-like cupin family protein
VWLSVSDLQASRKFYEGTLGLERLAGREGRTVKYHVGGVILALSQSDGMRAPRTGSDWVVFQVPNLRELADQLTKKGIRTLTAVREEKYGLSCEFTDPDGHRFQLHEPSEGAYELPKEVALHTGGVPGSDGGFIEAIRGLPQVDVHPSVNGYLAQGDDYQVVFMEFDDSVEMPDMAHTDHWGVVVDGSLELTVAGKHRLLRPGESFHIPRGARYRLRGRKGYRMVTIVFDKEHFRLKK